MTINISASHLRPEGEPRSVKPAEAKVAEGPAEVPPDSPVREGVSVDGPRSATEALLPTRLVRVGRESIEKQDAFNVDKRLEQLREIAERANAVLLSTQTHLQFVVAVKTGIVVVKVIDSETDEVIREIPPARLNRFASRLNEMRGLLFDSVG